MDRRRIILIGIAAAILLVGLVVVLALRKPKGPDCGLIARAATQSGRPVAALATLLGDDAKTVQTDHVKAAMAATVDVARVPHPIPDFTKLSVPEAVAKAQAEAQTWLACGAKAVVWGSVEHEGDQVIEDKRAKSKKPVTKPIYAYLLWVTLDGETTIQIARSKDGREAGEAVFRHWNERKRAQSAPIPAEPPPAQEAKPPAEAPAEPARQ